MNQICPKCHYARKPADAAVPDWQCPSCGIAYAKFNRENAPAPVALPREPTSSSSTLTTVFVVLVCVAAFGYGAYDHVQSKTGKLAECAGLFRAGERIPGESSNP